MRVMCRPAAVFVRTWSMDMRLMDRDRDARERLLAIRMA